MAEAKGLVIQICSVGDETRGLPEYEQGLL